MNYIKIIALCIVIVLCIRPINAQQTIKFTVEQAEKQFLEKNLRIFAERCNIGIADAAIVQAKLFNNPTITAGDINFWHSNAAEELEVSPSPFGNRVVYSLELEQMIRTAGKRRKLIDMEKVSKEIAIQEFEAFLSGLKTELKTLLYETLFLQSYMEIINLQLQSVNNLVEVYKMQSSRGNVAKSELIRLQVSLIELETEANEMLAELNSRYRELKVLLNIQPETAILLIPTTVLTKNPDEISLSNLMEMAINSRPEFLLADLDVKLNEKALKYEKAQRLPDISLSMNYDRYGGVWKNFIGFGIGVDIPMFDRNQGAIKMAKLSIEQANYNAENERNTVLHEIVEFFNNYKINYNFYRKLADSDFFDDLENMLEVYSRNLLNRNINMLEYIDFMEACLSAKKAILTAKKNLEISFAELEFSVNNQIK